MHSKLYCYLTIFTEPKDAIEFDDVDAEWQDVLSFPEAGDKMGPAVSVATYPKDCISRDKASALHADALVFDVDIWTDHKPFTFAELKEKLDGIRFIAWTTYNSSAQEYRWRVVIPVTTSIPANLYSSLWTIVNETWLDECGNATTRDISRFGFLPRLPNEEARADYIWHISKDERFDWTPYSEILEEEYMGAPKQSTKLAADFVKPSYWINEKQSIKKAKIYFKNVHKGVEEGSRHQVLFKAACRLWWDFAFEEESVRTVLLFINKSFDKPKDSYEVEKEVVEGWKRTFGDSAVEQPEAYGNQRIPAKYITTEELKQLAVSLKRKTSDQERIVGNRLVLLLKGESIAPPEDRVAAVFGLAEALAKVYTTDSPSRLAGFFAPSISVMQAQGPGCPSLIEVENRIKYIQDKKKQQDTLVEKQKKDELTASISRAFRGKRSTGYTEKEMQEYIKEGFTEKSWLVQYKDHFYVFIDGDYIGPFHSSAVVNACSQYLVPAYDYVKLTTFTDKGVPRLKTREELLKEYGWVVTSFDVDLCAQCSFLDIENERFVEAPLRQRELEPEYVEAVDLWLKAFAGDSYEKLLDWLSVITFVDRPCSALYLEGPAGCGKSLLVNGLARIWTEGGPCMLQDISDKWNEDITSCPIVFADELIPDDLVKLNSTAKFRQIIQDTRRPLRRKFKPNATMFGAIRMILAANNIDLLSTDESLTKNDIQAIKERVFHVVASKEATEYLESIGGYPVARTFIEKDLVAKHVLWLSESRAVAPEGRFIVKGESEQLSRLLATSGVVSDVCEWLVRFFTKPMYMQKNQFIVVKDGAIFARAGGISDNWEQYINTKRIPSLNRVGKSLKSLSLGEEPKALKQNGTVVRFWEVDIDNLVAWAADAGDFISKEELIEEVTRFEKKSGIKMVQGV